MKKVMLIGSSTCGKTTLCQRLNGMKIEYQKTQTVGVINNTIDTPGEYLENRQLYKGIIVTAADSDLILFLQDATDERFRFSPGQAAFFSVPVAGVVSKIDIATEEQVNDAVELLELAGCERIFLTSAVTGEGTEELLDYLNEEE
ncbi:MAG: EutP/PduV family microcompartment system protein [Clostridia bacterium]|nr:EutP/PduV family microcompartment system protein [Clostridia bacterium]